MPRPVTAPAEGLLARVLARFGLGFRSLRSDLAIAGSPERTEWRGVVEDGRGHLYVVEQVAARKVAHKAAIAATLAQLHAAGFAAVRPYRVAGSAGAVAEVDGSHWQVVPYVAGLAVPRPGWVHEVWRGEALADAALHVRTLGNRIPVERHGSVAITTFCRRLERTISVFRPELLRKLGDVLALVDDLRLVEPSLPTAFGHGDLHPLNVIWGLRGIKAVIDWEFCGHKLELYDAAVLIGCAGIEDPEGLRGRCVLAFLGRLREESDIAGYSWVYLHELVIAVRLAWLSEWLRSRDEEMIELELALLQLLVRQRAVLRSLWEA